MPDLSLDTALSDLIGWWLQCRCDCGRGVTIPCRMIRERVGPHRTLYHVLPRLRCEVCRSAFASVVAVTNPASGAPGRYNVPDGPRIVLAGEGERRVLEL